MKAIKRVKDKMLKTIGFILEDGNFYSDYFVKKNISHIENLKVLSNGVIRCESELPIELYSDILKIEYKQLKTQNPFVRDIQKELESWRKNPAHQVLQLEGARQIGKTTELKKFAYRFYDFIVYVNLSDDRFNFVSTVTQNGSSVFFMDIYCQNANLPKFQNDRKTVLIIDEIQESAEVYSSIRSLNENLNCDIIVTGSYLGRILGDKSFFLPSGTLTYLKMFPLSFQEFCRVFKKENLLKEISLFGESIEEDYNSLFSLYDIYRQIGGYPAVVKEYKRSKNVKKCLDVVAMVIETFKKESKRYFQNDKEIMIFDNVFVEAIRMMVKEKQGTGIKLVEDITQLVKGSQKCVLSRDEVSRAVRWFIYSGIIGECNLCIDGDIFRIEPARRLYYLDCGVANYIGYRAGLLTSQRDGLLTEIFAYSELYRLYAEKPSVSKVNGDYPCFSLLNGYELDFFVISHENITYGIEVKTDTGDPKSLKEFLRRGKIKRAVLAKRTKGGISDKIYTIPIYTIGCRFPFDI